MYYNGQIVWCEDTKTPVKVGGDPDSDGSDWAWGNIPANTRPFFSTTKSKVIPAITLSSDKTYPERSVGEIILPASVGDALMLLSEGKIE